MKSIEFQHDGFFFVFFLKAFPVSMLSETFRNLFFSHDELFAESIRVWHSQFDHSLPLPLTQNIILSLSPS